MKKINLLKELSKYPVFNLKTLKEITNTSRDYAKIITYRLKKDKLIFEIEKNKYTIQKDPFIISSNVIWPSYISCWTALRYHNLTEQLPEVFFVITTRARKKRRIKLENTGIVFIKILPKFFFGYQKEIYNGFNIFIADKEKAIIDSLLMKKVSFSEIYDIMKNNKKEIDFNLLVKYLLKINNKSLAKRFGFMLDSFGIDAYSKLKKLINPKYISLEIAFKPEGEKNKKWRIIKNVNI